MLVGVLLLLMLGAMVARVERSRARTPVWLGPTLLLMGLSGGVLMPPTGFWLVALLGLWLTMRRP